MIKYFPARHFLRLFYEYGGIPRCTMNNVREYNVQEFHRYVCVHDVPMPVKKLQMLSVVSYYVASLLI